MAKQFSEWNQQNGRLLSDDEAIEALGLGSRPNPKSSLQWLRRQKRIAYVQLGKGIYGYRREDLDALIEKSLVPAWPERSKTTKDLRPAR